MTSSLAPPLTFHESVSLVFGASPVVLGYDCTGSHESLFPANVQMAGYSTGTGAVPWTAAQFARHPGAVHIDQDPLAGDPTADALDVENGAATIADCPGWSHRAKDDFDAAKRPGQRSPAIYASASLITPVVNELIKGGIKSGVGLWVANWSITEAQAVRDVINAAGPFPIIGMQYASGRNGDFDVWSHAWLANVSKATPVKTGPQRHLLQVSLADFAASRSADPLEMLADTAAAYTKGDAAVVIPGLIVYTDH